MPPTDLSPFAYRIDVADALLVDLQERLDRTRWPIEPAAPRWRFGTDLTYLRSVMDYWRDHYDWRRWESRLNEFPQYRIPVDGRALHLLVEPGSGVRPRPLLLLNGWPSSIAEYIDVVSPLAHPERHGGDIEDAFTVIIPSYPGCGFSDPPAAPISVRDISRTLIQLVADRCGYRRFFVHGGDWGAAIGSWMAADAPERVIALHLNSAVLRQPLAGLALDPEEKAYLELRSAKLATEAGYQLIQGTRPQTLAYGLTDSPCGLAGWILEKFKAWVVPGTDEAPPFDYERLLTNVMIYWINGINAANWLYCDLFDGSGLMLAEGQRVNVPTGVLTGGKDLPPIAPDAWIRRSYNLVRQRNLPSMGHFPFMEDVAGAQTEELRRFFRPFRQDDPR